LGFKDKYQKLQANKAKSNKKKTKPTSNDTELQDIRIQVPNDGHNVHVSIFTILVLIHSFNCSHLLIHSFVCSIHSFIYPKPSIHFIYKFIYSSFHLFTHFFHSFMFSIHSFFHSFIHSLIHSFILFYSFLCCFLFQLQINAGLRVFFLFSIVFLFFFSKTNTLSTHS